MAITNSHWWWFSAWGNGYHTADVNIAPANVTVETALHGSMGGGTQYAGIKQIRKRLPSGADQDIDFGEWTSWPAVIGLTRLSSFTLAIATGSDQMGWLVARVDWWG